MGEHLSVRYCARCRRDVLHSTRGSVTQCCVCGHATAGGRVIFLGEPDQEERLRNRYRDNDMPVDEVAP